MDSELPNSTTQGDELPPYNYYFRALLVSVAGVGTLASSLTWPLQPPVALLMIILLAFPHISYHYTKRQQGAKAKRLTAWLGYIDAALIGTLLSFTNFSTLPCILFLTAIQFNALINGGMNKWSGDNIAFACGVFLSFFIYDPHWVFSSTLEITSVSLIGISTYYCVCALYVYKLIDNLKHRVALLNTKQQVYKLRAYKLSRYLPPPVWKAVNSDDDKDLKTSRKSLTIFFSDIKGFSKLSEELEAETLTDILNTYLTEMAKISTQFGGSIDKFIGDGIMITYGDGNSKGMKHDALNCLSMAIAMKKKMKILQHQWFNQGIKNPLQIRMGINTGYCTVGTFGTAHHLDYTVLGTHVNLANRLESAAEPGEILISYETWSLVKDVILCRDKGDISVKGFSHPVRVYQVMDFRKNLGRDQNYYEENHEGFSMHLDLEKVRNYDKEKVIESLESAANRLREKVIG